MRHPYPLRYTLPLGLLVLGLALTALDTLVSYLEIRRHDRGLMEQRAVGLGNVIVPGLEEEMLDHGADGAARIMRRLPTVAHLKSAVLCDANGRVIAAAGIVGGATRTPAGEPEWITRMIGDARQLQERTIAYSRDGKTLRAVFPVRVGSGDPNHWFCTESDVAGQMAPAVAGLVRRTGSLALLVLVACTALWFYFDRTITQRAQALVRAAKELAGGQAPTVPPATGSDEFAELGEAFGRMAEDIRLRDERVQQSEDRLAKAIQASELGTWDWDVETGVCIDNEAWSLMFGYQLGELAPDIRVWRELGHPDDSVRLQAALDDHFAGRTPTFECEHRMRHKSGRWIWVADTGRVVARTAAGAPRRVTGTTRNITARKHAELLLADQRDLLESIVAGQSLSESLASICRLAESRAEGMLCSILLLDRDGFRLRHGAAPSLDPEYCRAIDGVRIGPAAGSCGTAAFRRSAVVVADIETDPLWADFRELARAARLRACWSTPIFDSGGNVLGTFALYYREPRGALPEHQQIVQVATHTAALVLQRARAAEELRIAEERFEKAFRASPVATFISTLADGRMLDVNQAFLDMFGFPDRGHVIGRSSFELSMWSDTTDRARIADALQRRGSLQQIEASFRRHDGETRIGLASIERIEIDGRNCVLGLMYDVTERRQAERRLQEAEADKERHLALLEASLDSLTEGVIVSDLEGGVNYWNRAALQLHHYASLHECRRKLPEFADTFEFVAADGSIVPYEQWPLVRILRGETVRDWETRLRHKQAGWEKLFSYSGSLARDAAGRPLLAVLTLSDLTSRRQLEEQLRHSQKMDAIGQFAGGIAHDFNNILTAVIVRAELASSEPGLPAETLDALEEVIRLGQRAARLTRQLLAFSRRSVMHRTHIDLSESVNTDLKMIQRMVGEDIQIQLRLHPDPLVIHADTGMLGQVLLNLAVNARDAMPRGGRLEITTTRADFPAGHEGLPRQAAPGAYACLSLRDHGTGIAAADLPRIFEPFFTTKAIGKGSGLGLATVFGIVQQHAGWITAGNHPDGGAVFHIYLPLAEGLPETDEKSEADSRPRGTETVLFVEDEEAVRVTACMLLRHHGYTVLEAEHGPAAREIWQREKHRVQLLITDIVMPEGVSGNELAAEFQAEIPALPVILTTGYSARIAGRELQLRKRQSFLQKPFALGDLLTKVRSSLDQR